MRKIFLLPVLSLLFIPSLRAQNFNFDYRGQILYPYSCASIWGYVDDDETEYALVGTYDGVSIVDVSDPDNPEVKFNVSHTASEWREIKTYGHYAYATNESGGGLLVIDLSDLPNSVQTYSFTYTDAQGFTQESGHTLYIDENGRLYIFGGSYSVGGATMFDLTSDPIHPPYLGKYENHYIHDGFVRGDTLWASEIYNGQLEMVNVSNPALPVPMASVHTTSNFTHNAWPTHDDHYVFTTDEVNDSYLTSYDVSDFSNITALDKVQSNPGSGVIIHNVHLLNDQFAVVAYYKDGVVLFDVSHPDNMIEVGSYDTDPGESGGDYGGTWGVYPYLPSGNIIASDIWDAGTSNGKLTIITPTYVAASWLEGTVTDSITGAPVNNVHAEILSTQNDDYSDLGGGYKTGDGISGTYSVQYSKIGYVTKTISVTLTSGVVTTEDVQLVPLTAFSYIGQVLDSATNTPLASASVFFDGGTNGTFTATTDVNGNFSLTSIYEGNYNIFAGKWGHRTKEMANTSLNQSSSPLVIKLKSGYYDDFFFNFSWVPSGGNPGTGKWVRGEPVGTSDADGVYNPEEDVTGDFGDQCFVTGNEGGAPGNSDVDNDVVTLTSPVFDLTTYVNPHINFYAWWVDAGPFGNPDDTLKITITNGTATVPLLTMDNTSSQAAWVFHSFKVSDFISLTNNMKLKLSTVDHSGNANWIEAGLDLFEVTDSLATGIASPVSDLGSIALYPNPFNNESLVQYDLGAGSFNEAQIEIFNELGQKVEAYALKTSSGTIKWGQMLGSGMYFVKLTKDGTTIKMIPAVKTK